MKMNLETCLTDKMNKIYKLLITVIFISVSLLLLTTEAVAAPAAPIEVTMTQPDGTEFSAKAWGDAWLNGMETVEGYTILLSPHSDYWVYAQLDPELNLAPSLVRGAEMIVGRDDPSSLPKHIRPVGPLRDAGFSPSRIGTEGALLGGNNIGERNLLVLLVQFQDISGRTSPADWHNRIFGESNSLTHYYDEVSYGQLEVIPAAETHGTVNDGVVGWLTLPYNHPNTGINFNRQNLQIVRDAIIAADPYINFADYDRNGDGYISFDELSIMVIVAGHEGAYGGIQACSPNVWAHQNALDRDGVFAPVVDGKRVASFFGNGGYTQFGEIHCEPANFPGHPATIGVIVHEFGHDLQWPDLYDTSFKTEGIGYWGLMGYGMWNHKGNPVFAGDSPAHPTAWSRWYQGWLTPHQAMASSLSVDLPQVKTSGVVLQMLENPNGVNWIWNQQSGQGRYYLIENRQLVGYDEGLPGCGLLIWQINESVRFDNFANADANNRLVDLVQADGLRQLNIPTGNRGDAGDPYPGTTENRIFNAASDPSSNQNGVPSGVSVTDISDCGPVMTANFFIPTFDDVTPTDWSWNAVEALFASGITEGCGGGNYCSDQSLSRSEMAVLMMRAKGIAPSFDPAGEQVFSDVPPDHWAAGWIEAFYHAGITVGCDVDPLRYCPEAPVSRAEMAVFILRYKYGKAFQPPPGQGLFSDVADDHWAVDWIEQLFQEDITTGCANHPLQYCPEQPVTRAEIAVFLTRALDLPQP